MDPRTRALLAFLMASSFPEKFAILEEQADLLLTDEAEPRLRELAARAIADGHAEFAARIARDHMLLRIAREQGLQAAREHVLREQGHSPFPDALVGNLLRADQLDAPSQLAERIAILTEAIASIHQEEHPALWAGIHNQRADAYLRLPTGDPAQNLERALADLTTAAATPRDEMPLHAWIGIHLNRGTTYQKRLSGGRSENIERAIADFGAVIEALGGQQPNAQAYPSATYDWASARMQRGVAYTERLRDSRRDNVEHAIRDFNAALEVFEREGRTEDAAGLHVNRGMAYTKRLHSEREDVALAALADPGQANAVLRTDNIERAIADFDAALGLVTKDRRPDIWAGAHANRAIAYAHRTRRGDFTENLERALESCDAALTVVTREAAPLEWARLMHNRGAIYARRIMGDPQANQRAGLADLDAAASLLTAQVAPESYRDIQIHRAWVFERQQRWHDAHAAYLDARRATHLLIERANTEQGLDDVIGERADMNLSVRDARVLLKCSPPDVAEAAAALEEGRAQHARRAIDLDAAAIERPRDPAAAQRASAFLEARASWQAAQRATVAPLPPDADIDLRNRLTQQRQRELDNAYGAFLQARDAIREYDDPNFLTISVSRDQIARALPSAGQALVYLVADHDTGFAVIVRRVRDGTAAVEHRWLPRFTYEAIRDLAECYGSTELMYQGRRIQMALPIGGFLQGQFGILPIVLFAQGDSFAESARRLPEDSGFRRAAEQLLGAWSDDAHVALCHASYNALNADERNELLGAFVSTVVAVELERMLPALGELGLSDLAQHLTGLGTSFVTFITYGKLGTLPLPAVEVLVDGAPQRLGELFEVTLAPSARALEEARHQVDNYNHNLRPLLLVAGNPQPQPVGVASLEWAEAEADTVRRIARDTYHLSAESIRYLSPRSATKERISAALHEAWYAHLALHGQYQADDPRASCLLLAGDEHAPVGERTLTLGEALDGAVALRGLRLLVLSACDTALIETRQVPDEVVGLAAGFLQAGAAGVIASLWAVDDRATFLLMARFAEYFLDPGRGWSPARCLAAAQKWLREATNETLLHYDPYPELQAHQGTTQLRALRFSYKGAITEVRLAASRGDPNTIPYADPFYWAGFVVTGC